MAITKEEKVTIPCMEPTRYFISCPTHNIRLRCWANGRISSSANYMGCEEWLLIPVDDEAAATNTIFKSFRKSESQVFLLQSCKYGKFLNAKKSDSDNGEVGASAEAENATRWHMDTKSDGCVSLVTEMADGKIRELSCDERGIIRTISTAADLDLKATAIESVCEEEEQLSNTQCAFWKFALSSGELCYISSPTFDKRISCNPFGKLITNNAWKGWEIWRFIECSDSGGSVYISSWTHREHILSSSPYGEVSVTKNYGNWEKWHITRSDEDGVMLTSVEHGMVLMCNENGSLYTTKDKQHAIASSNFHLEVANANVFYISSHLHDKRIGGGTSQPFITQKRKSWEEWRIQDSGCNDGTVSIFSLPHGTYLGSNEDGILTMSPHATDSERWIILPMQGGGYCIESEEHPGRKIACVDGARFIVTNDPRVDVNGETCFHLEPKMPFTIGGKDIGMLAAGGVLSIGLAAVAMPALIAGMATEGVAAAAAVVAADVVTGEAAVTAGMSVVGVSAAIGSGAIVGGSIAAVSTKCRGGINCVKSDGGEDEDAFVIVGSSGEIMNRPFCAWRSW
eukprot:CAMPEP_0195517508 /NCGR_PEP_ID=MMETSP0794_2-20130614/10982_1 /TAXON_ID=515487 /ORGANISM="Stephanopyxis turris, Strain CCMP 815" /LENGTH=567 /DNA_ID=CAMNT_0040646323 /DNA_START=194 /DNA_END=1897 /DNA_ORIENTATION=+